MAWSVEWQSVPSRSLGGVKQEESSTAEWCFESIPSIASQMPAVHANSTPQPQDEHEVTNVPLGPSLSKFSITRRYLCHPAKLITLDCQWIRRSRQRGVINIHCNIMCMVSWGLVSFCKGLFACGLDQPERPRSWSPRSARVGMVLKKDSI